MIRGQVDHRLQSQIAVKIVAESGQRSQVEAIIDTGFTGYLTLSASQINELGLMEKGAREARLADGQLATFGTFLVPEGAVSIVNAPKRERVRAMTLTPPRRT